MKKKFTFVGMLLFSLIITAACTKDQSTNQDTNKKGNIEITISAAASLKDAMEVIQDKYKEENPEVTLKFNFGGSGSLQQQILQGAPVDLFFSAAEDKFDLLIEEGAIAEEDGVDLLGNSLSLIVSKGEQSIKDFDDLAKAETGHISIGTPETVPAGKYAKQSLENMNLWKDIESKVVYAKDVRQVLSYVETANVEAGVVYTTDALGSDKVDIIASADPTTHDPVVYPIGIIKDSKQYEAAKDFYAYLQGDYALKVFEEYGFTTQ